MALFRALIPTNSVGSEPESPEPNSFNDAEKCLSSRWWSIYTNQEKTATVGLRVVYDVDGKDVEVLHGIVGPNSYPISLMSNGSTLTSLYGTLAPEGSFVIVSIAFVRFNEKDGTVDLQGPKFCPPSAPTAALGTFGKVVAFVGTEDADGKGLLTLAFYKADDALGGTLS